MKKEEQPQKVIEEIITSLVLGRDCSDLTLSELSQRNVSNVVKALMYGFPGFRSLVPKLVLDGLMRRKKGSSNYGQKNDASIVIALMEMSCWCHNDSVAESKIADEFDRELSSFIITSLAKRYFHTSPIDTVVSSHFSRSITNYTDGTMALVKAGNRARLKELYEYFKLMKATMRIETGPKALPILSEFLEFRLFREIMINTSTQTNTRDHLELFLKLIEIYLDAQLPFIDVLEIDDKKA